MNENEDRYYTIDDEGNKSEIAFLQGDEIVIDSAEGNAEDVPVRPQCLSVTIDIDLPRRSVRELKKLFKREDLFKWQKRRLKKELGRCVKARIKQ